MTSSLASLNLDFLSHKWSCLYKYYRAARQIKWEHLWNAQHSVRHSGYPSSNPCISHRFIKEKNLAYLEDIILHFTKAGKSSSRNHSSNQSFKQNHELGRGEGSVHRWIELFWRSRYSFFSPKLKQVSIIYVMKQHKISLCFVTWKV